MLLCSCSEDVRFPVEQHRAIVITRKFNQAPYAGAYRHTPIGTAWVKIIDSPVLDSFQEVDITLGQLELVKNWNEGDTIDISLWANDDYKWYTPAAAFRKGGDYYTDIKDTMKFYEVRGHL